MTNQNGNSNQAIETLSQKLSRILHNATKIYRNRRQKFGRKLKSDDIKCENQIDVESYTGMFFILISLIF